MAKLTVFNKFHYANDPQANRLLIDAQALGFGDITKIDCYPIYFVEGDLTELEKERLASELLSDPVSEFITVNPNGTSQTKGAQRLEIALRPGVTDPIAEQIVRGAQLLGINTLERVATGEGFIIHATHPLSEKELHTLASRLLANPVIHHYAIGNIQPSFPIVSSSAELFENISIRSLNDDQLCKLSQDRRAALDLSEMQTIQQYYQIQQRDPTDVEFETIAQTWSEHCSHKTFRADILHETSDGPTIIPGLLKSYIRKATETINAPWVYSAFVDNAGIIDFDDEYQVSFKVETHNHPSAIEPFGGSNTGLGGVIRDVLGVSSKPIANTDIFCFGPQNIDLHTLPEGTLHPRLIQSGVVAGVQDYGNKTGIPTVNGAIWYDAGYTANPLVYCGCVGLLPKNKHPRAPQVGDHVIILGGRTGRDGLRGATFSSMTMDAQTGEVAGASVQIGNPIIAKGLIEVVTRARDLGLYHAITDCGAGGLSSAVGEMASEIGADVDLKYIQLKYPGLVPWEIWLSEAQERMALAVPTKHLKVLANICNIYEIEMTDMGHFTGTKQLVVRYNQQIVLQLDNDFLYDGMPKKQLVANIKAPTENISATFASTIQPEAMLLELLSHPNIASKEAVIRRYDHEIQAGTVVKPLTGAQNDGPSDAAVLKPFGTKGVRGIVLANGLNPEFGKYDAYKMALSVVDEAIRNAVATGANPDRIAILDNFCWGDPKRPETLGSLTEAARGCYAAALHYQTPFISGKDSLNNEYVSTDGQRHAIPGTLLISAIGLIEDIHKAVTMDFKKAGNSIYLLGETKFEFLGSHFNLCHGDFPQSNVPDLPEYAPKLYRALYQAMQHQLVRAAHDLSEGGLAVAIAEMCIGGRLGCELTLAKEDKIITLFSESNGRLLIEVEAENCTKFESYFDNNLIQKIGYVTQESKLLIQHNNETIIALSVAQLMNAWQNSAYSSHSQQEASI